MTKTKGLVKEKARQITDLGSILSKKQSGVQLVKVAGECQGQKLISFLKQKTGLPYSRLMKLIRTGQIRINGKRALPFYRLQLGEEIRIPPYTPPLQAKFSLKLDLIYENEQILILNKPAGLAVHKGSKTPFSLMDVIQQKYKHLPYVPTPVHRLDKETSGLMVLAKSFQTLTDLQANWDQVEKKYLAVINGIWPYNQTITLSHYLFKPKTGAITDHLSKGKKSVCEVRPLAKSQNHSLLEVRLITGRTRQIRAQLAFQGYPILGDKKFSSSKLSLPLHLHAYFLSLQGNSFKCYPNWKILQKFQNKQLNFV